MEWELSKENVQPLKEGRNVEKLNAILKARVGGGYLKGKIWEQYRKMVEAIDDYEGNDPLQPWIECINWVKETYPSGGSQSRLLLLLELCVRTFCKDKQYADDIRYLKVWMDYADHCSSPEDIYRFLQENNIGQGHALFYEQCARYWEEQHKYSQAMAAYELGISRKVQPLDMLKVASTRFMQRMLRESIIKENLQSPPSQEVPGRSFGNQLAGRNNGGLHLQKVAGSKVNRNTPQLFSVFVDADLRPGVHIPKTVGSTFTSELERNKENLQKPSKIAGTKVQRLQAPVATPVELNVFKDEDCLVQIKPLKKKMPTSLALRLDDINASDREENRLKQNPLVYFDDEVFESNIDMAI